MEQTLGDDSVPAPGSLDKSRVLNVRPLRSLVPIFPSGPNTNSFSSPQCGSSFCVHPSGPFPPGVSPFYPFAQNAVSGTDPVTSFRTPPSSAAGPLFSGAANGGTGSSRRTNRVHNQSYSYNGVVEEEYSDPQNEGVQNVSSFGMHIVDEEDASRAGRAQKRAQKRTRDHQDINYASPDVDTDAMVDDILKSYNLVEFDKCIRSEGDNESVKYALFIYDLLRRIISQHEDSKEATLGAARRRPDLRAGTVLMNKGIRTNIKRTIGAAPGVEVGDIFFFRMELCLVGLHAPIMAGIGYMALNISQVEEEPIAVSIVSSGGYDDNAEDGDVLIYSGQGGNIYRKDKAIADQKLERGNLALEKSLHRGNEVRVIRGVKDLANPTGKVYVYDGLYKINESWVEKGKSGCNVFKYKLVRLPGQPEAFMIWKSIQQWRDSSASRFGLILPDLTSGAENLPVSLVNDVDDEKGPAHFTYVPSLKYSKPVTLAESSMGCACKSGCVPSILNCPCVQKNGGYLPYTANGVLVDRKSLIHECGLSCECPPNCRNRVTQGGLKVRLEVFKTKDKGWGLRSWDPIRAGAFICEYAGEVIDVAQVEELGGDNEDDYIFDATRNHQPVERQPGDCNEDPKLPFPLVINAKNVGNVARFMNHSCSPNVFWQPVSREHNNKYDLHIAFYSNRHIPPMTELTYSYGMVSPDKVDKKKKCLCGSVKCSGYFF